MLRVTVELVPFGDESKAKKVGEMVLANDGRGYGNHHSYEGWIGPDEWSGDPALFGKVDRYDRRENVWILIRRMIEEAFPKHLPNRDKEGLSARLKKHLGFKFQEPKGPLCGPKKKTKKQKAKEIEEMVKRISFKKPRR
jgi:hypothetical protein